MKILLLQARAEDDPVREAEVVSFAEKAGLPIDAFTAHNLVDGAPSLDLVQRHAALMVGGSGDYYVSNRDLPGWDRLMDTLRETVERSHPTFASCFGFHLFVEALGGRIVHDRPNTELGTYEVTLTPEGADDELLGLMPAAFNAQLGHKDRADTLPPNALHLAFSEACPFQAFRIPGKPIWATQFHPEMTEDENRNRFLRYVDGYHVGTHGELKAVLARFRPSPHPPKLLRAFLQLIQGSGR